MPFGLIQVLLGVGMLLISWIGLGVLATARPAPTGPLLRRVRAGSLAPAVAGAGSQLLPEATALAVGFALPWAALCGAATLAGAVGWLRRPSRDIVDVAPLAATGYLTVGAVWLVLDRAGVRPLGLTPAIVLLTAVHFHHAGFVATTIATRTVGNASPGGPLRIARIGAWSVVAGPPVVAIGFAAYAPAQVAGALVLTAGLLAIAHVLFRDIRPRLDDRVARVLTGTAALAVVVPMSLASHWAAGTNLGWPVLSIPAMARTHGLLNALGFGLCGLVAFQLADARGLTVDRAGESLDRVAAADPAPDEQGDDHADE